MRWGSTCPGGWGVIAINREGHKVWSFKRAWGGGTYLAATARYLYVGWEEGQLYRLNAATGAFAPLTRPDGKRATDLFLHKEGEVGNLVGRHKYCPCFLTAEIAENAEKKPNLCGLCGLCGGQYFR